MYDGNTYLLDEAAVPELLANLRNKLSGEELLPLTAKLRHGKELLILVGRGIPVAVLRRSGKAEDEDEKPKRSGVVY